MNVYDFDNTIYNGESVFDFYIFCVKRYPFLVKYFFTVLFTWFRYRLLLLSRDKLMDLAEKYSERFFEEVKNVEELVKKFWDENQKKIKKFYLETKKEDDVIISASANFLMDEICRRIGVKNCVCSEVDVHTGHIGALCFRQNKPELFRERFPMGEIENFFSDSMNDRPMMKMAKNAYLVKDDKIIPVEGKRLR